MSYTVNEIYNMALSLCDYYDDKGTFETSPIIKALKNKTPYLCDIAQRDLIYGQGITKTETRIYSPKMAIAKTSDGYYLYKLPDDYITLIRVIDSENAKPMPYICENYIFIFGDKDKELTLLYKSSPAKITDMTSSFSLCDNIIGGLLPYYLAANFLAEENPIKSSLYIGLYEKAKQNCLILNTLSEIELIDDSY